jgi:hypothetical protein
MFGKTFRPLISRAQSLAQASQRRGGHWLHKNARAEENSGLRENSIASWKFDDKSIPQLLGFVLIPGAVFYVVCIEELERKHEQIGHPKVFGVVPGLKSGTPEKK